MQTGFELETSEGAFAELPVSECERRDARQRLMELADLDGLLLSQNLNVRCLTGYHTVLWDLSLPSGCGRDAC